MVRRLLLFTLLLAAAVLPVMAQTTPNLHLNLPPRDTKFWDVPMNQNFTLLDNFLSGVSPLPAAFPYVRKGTISGIGNVLCTDASLYATTVACTIPAPTSLDAAVIDSGTLDILRIPNMDAAKIASGTFPIARIPVFGTGGTSVLTTTLTLSPTVGKYMKWAANGQIIASTYDDGAAAFGLLTGNPTDNTALTTALAAKPTISGSPAANDCAKWVSATTITTTGAPCGSGGASVTFQVGGTNTTSQSTINFQSTGPNISISNPSAGNVLITTTQPVRLATLIVGNGSTAITTGDGLNHFFINRYGFTVTVQEIYCETDTGTVVINLQRDDGTPANIPSATLTCSTTGASTTSFNGTENVLLNGDKVNFQSVTPDGVAKLVRLVVRYQ